MENKKNDFFRNAIIILLIAVLFVMVFSFFIKNNKIVSYKYKRDFGRFEFETVISGNKWKNNVIEVENIAYIPLDKEPTDKAKKEIIETQEKMDSDIRSIKGIKYKVDFLPGKVKKSYTVPVDSQENIKECIKLGILDADENAKSINFRKTIKAMDESDEWEKVKN